MSSLSFPLYPKREIPQLWNPENHFTFNSLEPNGWIVARVSVSFGRDFYLVILFYTNDAVNNLLIPPYILIYDYITDFYFIG